MATLTTDSPSRKILLTGATGYVGSRLLKRLENAGETIRCLARSPEKLRDHIADDTEIVAGDVLNPDSLRGALQNVDLAYYLVHLMGAGADFAEQDRQAARNFAEAARDAGVKRIVYLGGLGEEHDPRLSPHLRSRHEVGEILRKSGVETIEFRASIVIGDGSLSFDMIRSLTDRLPVMICPRWLATPTQPIAVGDVLGYLHHAADLPLGESRIYEIGGRDVATYGQLIQEYAKQQGLKRVLVSVPLLTPYLSSLWLGLVTPSTAEVGRHLIEGLKNPTIVRDKSALSEFPVEPLSIPDAIAAALAEAAESSSEDSQ